MNDFASSEACISSRSATISLRSGREVRRPISSFSLSVMPYSWGQMKSKSTLARLYSSRSFSNLASVFAFVLVLPVKRWKYYVMLVAGQQAVKKR